MYTDDFWFPDRSCPDLLKSLIQCLRPKSLQSILNKFHALLRGREDRQEFLVGERVDRIGAIGCAIDDLNVLHGPYLSL